MCIDGQFHGMAAMAWMKAMRSFRDVITRVCDHPSKLVEACDLLYRRHEMLSVEAKAAERQHRDTITAQFELLHLLVVIARHGLLVFIPHILVRDFVSDQRREFLRAHHVECISRRQQYRARVDTDESMPDVDDLESHDARALAEVERGSGGFDLQ